MRAVLPPLHFELHLLRFLTSEAQYGDRTFQYMLA
jgi:hypothetical protein